MNLQGIKSDVEAIRQTALLLRDHSILEDERIGVTKTLCDLISRLQGRLNEVSVQQQITNRLLGGNNANSKEP